MASSELDCCEEVAFFFFFFFICSLSCCFSFAYSCRYRHTRLHACPTQIFPVLKSVQAFSKLLAGTISAAAWLFSSQVHFLQISAFYYRIQIYHHYDIFVFKVGVCEADLVQAPSENLPSAEAFIRYFLNFIRIEAVQIIQRVSPTPSQAHQVDSLPKPVFFHRIYLSLAFPLSLLLSPPRCP